MSLLYLKYELSTFYDLMKITSQRDEFGIHSLAYYQRAFDLFHAHDQCLVATGRI